MEGPAHGLHDVPWDPYLGIWGFGIHIETLLCKCLLPLNWNIPSWREEGTSKTLEAWESYTVHKPNPCRLCNKPVAVEEETLWWSCLQGGQDAAFVRQHLSLG